MKFFLSLVFVIHCAYWAITKVVHRVQYKYDPEQRNHHTILHIMNPVKTLLKCQNDASPNPALYVICIQEYQHWAIMHMNICCQLCINCGSEGYLHCNYISIRITYWINSSLEISDITPPPYTI